MALRCVLQPSPPSELVSMTIAGNFNPSHQRNGMERCPKEMEKQQLSSKPLGLDPHEQVPLLLCCAVPAQISHCILCFCLKNGDSSACGNGAAGALFPSLVPTKPVSPRQSHAQFGDLQRRRLHGSRGRSGEELLAVSPLVIPKTSGSAGKRRFNCVCFKPQNEFPPVCPERLIS